MCHMNMYVKYILSTLCIRSAKTICMQVRLVLSTRKLMRRSVINLLNAVFVAVYRSRGIATRDIQGARRPSSRCAEFRRLRTRHPMTVNYRYVQKK